MPQVKSEYESLDEFSDIAKKLVKKYPDVFHSIDVDAVKCVAVVNKDRPDSSDKLWDVLPVKQPVRADCAFGWYVIIFLSDWEELGDKHRPLLVANALCAIPGGEDGEGKKNAPDYKDFALMLRTFGVDYMNRSDVPDILADDVDWKA